MDKLEAITNRIIIRFIALIGFMIGVVLTLTAHGASDKLIDADMEVKVPGLVCSSCAIGIKRKLKPEITIKDIAFDTKKQLLLIDFVELKGRIQWLRNDRIIFLVKKAGYEVTSIKRLDNSTPNRYNQP